MESTEAIASSSSERGGRGRGRARGRPAKAKAKVSSTDREETNRENQTTTTTTTTLPTTIDTNKPDIVDIESKEGEDTLSKASSKDRHLTTDFNKGDNPPSATYSKETKEDTQPTTDLKVEKRITIVHPGLLENTIQEREERDTPQGANSSKSSENIGKVTLNNSEVVLLDYGSDED